MGGTRGVPPIHLLLIPLRVNDYYATVYCTEPM